ncbi:unnamed protein product [Porites lobata]|uniref:Uncharacterized protein n=1 Tax=Porites lobata TaxID=104759 RepID=A0ABN8RB40_9CNID|nr:unnamed protein product [Porites lobata]
MAGFQRESGRQYYMSTKTQIQLKVQMNPNRNDNGVLLLPKPLQKHVIQTSAMYLSCAVHFQTGKKEVLLLSALVAVVTLRVNCWTERGMTWFVLHYKR